MSWSVSFIGTPEKITQALNKESSRLTGHSKEEFDKALPPIFGLLKLNTSEPETALRICLSGHSYGPVYSNCFVVIEPLNGVIV